MSVLSSRRAVTAVICVVFGAVALALPASAPAAVTFGSSLSTAGGVSDDCSGTDECTSGLEAVEGGARARSPIDGVVVRWRLRTNAAQGGSVRLRVIRELGATSWYFVGSSGYSLVPPVADVHLFPARVRIAAGEYIGLDRPAAIESVFRGGGGAVTHEFGTPPLDGETVTSTGTNGRELLVNADVEPDADKDGFGDETQDGCPSNASAQGPCPSSPPPPQGTPSVLDRRVPLVRLAIKRVQDVDKLAVSARMDEDGALAAGGIVQTARVRRLPRRARSVRLRRSRRTARARRRVTLRPRLPRRSLVRVKRAMRRGELAVATVTIVGADRAGNIKRIRRRIRLKP